MLNFSSSLTFCSIVSPQAGRASIRMRDGRWAWDEGAACVGHKRGSSVWTDVRLRSRMGAGRGGYIRRGWEQGRMHVVTWELRALSCCVGFYFDYVRGREQELRPDAGPGLDVRALGLLLKDIYMQHSPRTMNFEFSLIDQSNLNSLSRSYGQTE